MEFKSNESIKTITIATLEDKVPEPDIDYAVHIIDVNDNVNLLDQAIISPKNNSFKFTGN